MQIKERFDLSSNNIDTLRNLMNSHLNATDRRRAIELAHRQLTALFQQYQLSNENPLNNYLTQLDRHLNDDRNRSASDIFYLRLLEQLREPRQENLFSNHNHSFIEAYLSQSRRQEISTNRNRELFIQLLNNRNRENQNPLLSQLLDQLRESSEENLLSDHNRELIQTYLSQIRGQQRQSQTPVAVASSTPLPSINEAQKALISAYLYFIFDDINELNSPVELLKAFNLILANTVSEQDKIFFVGKGKWESIEQLKNVLSHREPHKLLNLEVKNKEYRKIGNIEKEVVTTRITKDSVVNFITSLVQQQIQIQKEASAKKIQKAYRHYRPHLFHQKPSAAGVENIDSPSLSAKKIK